MHLSKSLYTRGMQCPKSLWLKKYAPNVLTPPDEAAIARFKTGNAVGDLACELFPDGREVAFDSQNFEKMAEMTRQWLDEGLEHIYEATFIFEGIVVMVDILRQTFDGVEIYEVKSSGSVKEIFLHDVAIQHYVLKQLGYHVVKSHVVHLDHTYVRDDALDLHRLFKIVDVSAEADALQTDIPKTLSEFARHLSDRENEPDIEIGVHCKKPYECDAMHYCWQVQRNIPNYSIFNIFNLGSANQIALYDRGIVAIEEIPDDFKMTALQKQKVDNWKAQRIHIDKEPIKSFLDALTWPVYHLDFETFQQPIPQWKGIRPNQQIPFQYSLHIEHQDGRLEHREYLGVEGEDPRRALAARLVSDIPDDVTVLAYYMSFEKGVIETLADSFAEFADHLRKVSANIHDLIIPFSKQHYVTPAMQGSSSIKRVMPALAPEMKTAYQELDSIHDGNDAMQAYGTLHLVQDETERRRIRDALLAYCRLDTLSMVKILKKLKEVTTIDYKKRLTLHREYNAEIYKVIDSSIESDRGRILSAPAFRRLQKRTQVFALELNASIRTRLTHSLEVGQTARFIAKTILAKLSSEDVEIYGLDGLENAFISTAEMTSLLHDIGNPPFGHFAEQTINKWMTLHARPILETLTADSDAAHRLKAIIARDICNYDGNAQAIRVITKLQRLNLSYTQILAVLKYTRGAYENRPDKDEPFDYLMKKPGYYFSEQDLITKIQTELGVEPGHRFPITYIMEAADDISYLTADLEDSVSKGILGLDDVYHLIKAECEREDETYLLEVIQKRYDEAKQNEEPYQFNMFFTLVRAKLVTSLVYHVADVYVKNHEAIFRGAFNHALLEFDKQSKYHKAVQILGRISLKHIYQHKEVQQMELKGYAIINGLLDIYKPLLDLNAIDFTNLLQDKRIDCFVSMRLIKRISSKQIVAYQHDVQRLDTEDKERYALLEWYYRVRLLTDYVSGMTDDFALHEYKLLSAI